MKKARRSILLTVLGLVTGLSIWLAVFSWVLYKNRDELEKISKQKHF
ncbi:hypothetical protein [Streptococcus oricebi]|uniref:Uncharacterized protein n=1 Tax=Streptococcus oricebi TaxID=1547447 RepID=A0ABS5B3H3_9STRE|nr:hypothetical protein [Streptococcus oricebi]MBP2623315.1 hypothetical protein [Streptococcus oricebi]